MAELKPSEVKYGASLSTKLGGLLFTATQIETPSGAEYAEGGIELNPAKLGLADEAVAGSAAVAGEGSQGEAAATSALPVFAWCTPLQTAKVANEKGKPLAVMFPAGVTVIEGKLFLRIYAQETAGLAGPLKEPKTSTKAAISLCNSTVFVLGK